MEVAHSWSAFFMVILISPKATAMIGDKSKMVLDLSPKALYELAAPSTSEEIREEVERRVAAGELVSAADVRFTMPGSAFSASRT